MRIMQLSRRNLTSTINENWCKGRAQVSSSLPKTHLAVCCEAREHHIVLFKLDHHVFCLPVHIPGLRGSNSVCMSELQGGP